ncbi:MAG TPA: DUF2793 domain-containing protein [Rhizomicrobium sp.]|nr:DUF2793 domain-containing protein [Rhizomicrobium sp.]
MTTTPRFQTPLLAAAQAQKHITHNEALEQLDALVCARFLDRDLSAPPSSPTDGDVYLIKPTAAGAWATHDNQIAQALDGAWRFYAPFTGLIAYVADEQKLIAYTGSAWVDYASLLALQNVPLLGVNATADSINKLTVASAAILLDNIGAGVQTKLNKHAAADTASLLYQTNYSGRAELGLTGDDDLHIKVSADGTTWFEAFKAARATGLITLVGDPTSASHAATKQYTDRAVARHADIAGSLTVTSTYFGETLRIDATSGAATITLPASATSDDWITIRKSDSSSNRVTVKNNAGTDLAWLSSQYDQAAFAWWGGAWVVLARSVAPLTELFTASGTWTKPPLATSVDVIAIGGGAGGGSGRRGAASTARTGGAGGAGAPCNRRTFAASTLAATATVTIGAGGAGGAAITSNDTDGNTGTAGGATSFGTYLKASGAPAGAGGSTAAASGGGATQATFGNGQAGTNSQSSANAINTPTASAGAGGGAAGGQLTTANAAVAGGTGGDGSIGSTTLASGGALGANTGASGGAGTSVTDVTTQIGGGGGGGGGANTSGAAGAGGDGGTPGGGGGGGGAALNGNASGAGGAGARGELRITTTF